MSDDQREQVPDPQSMRVDPARAKQLLANLEHVLKQVDTARGSRKVRLIAVSKLKPATDILALHQPTTHLSNASTPPPRPQIHFGENYAQELTQKASLLPRSIKWHMIGGLQTNKCKPLAEAVPNLWCVSSVDTAKKADALDRGRAVMLEREGKSGAATTTDTAAAGVPQTDATATATMVSREDGDRRLRVLIQVNTSGEESKSGVTPGEEAVALAKHITSQCPNLRLAGFMTIGAIARSKELGPGEENEDFERLVEVRKKVAEELGAEVKEDGGDEEMEGDDGWVLSMGMSSDFEAAIKQGSGEVRVGTGIFGDRPPKNEARIL